MENPALLSCLKCGKEISPEALICPHCGHPNKKVYGFQWRSSASVGSWPLVHIAFGKDAKTGKWLIAKGVVAIGQYAVGVVTIAQFGIGALFGFGQFMIGYYGLAQFVIGLKVIGQFAIGKYVLAQFGLGEFVWAMNRKDPGAVEYFCHLWAAVKQYLGLS